VCVQHGASTELACCCVFVAELGLFSSTMSKTWWFARVKDTNAVELFVEKTSRGEIEYLFANTDKGNKTVDVSKLTSLHALRINFCMLPYY
jgi:hypothetical protein